jgi:hypothetical protein
MEEGCVGYLYLSLLNKDYPAQPTGEQDMSAYVLPWLGVKTSCLYPLPLLS